MQGNLEALSQRLNDRINMGLAQNLTDFETRLSDAMSSIRDTVELALSIAARASENGSSAPCSSSVAQQVVNETPIRAPLGTDRENNLNGGERLGHPGNGDEEKTFPQSFPNQPPRVRTRRPSGFNPNRELFVETGNLQNLGTLYNSVGTSNSVVNNRHVRHNSEANGFTQFDGQTNSSNNPNRENHLNNNNQTNNSQPENYHMVTGVHHGISQTNNSQPENYHSNSR